MLERLQLIGEIFHANMVKYCVLRFPHDWEHNDVDILIRSDMSKVVRQILLNQGFDETASDKNTHTHYKKEGLHLDIVPVLAYGEREQYVINGDKVVERSAINETGLYVPCHTDDFFLTLCRAIFDKDDLVRYESHIRGVGQQAGHTQLISYFEPIFSGEKPKIRTMGA